jgi:hypothetical protein
MARKHTTDFFDRLEYYVIRGLIVVLLLITVYRILDSEIHIGRVISRLVGS